MALVRGMSMLSTRKRKVKITKAKMAQYESNWLIHNKRCKQNGMHELRYSTVEDYIDYCHGRKQKSTQEFQPLVTNTVYRRESDVEYPSLTKGGHGGGTKKEPLMYTGTLITGIATMHKSNAVPVMRGTDQATEISRMAK